MGNNFLKIVFAAFAVLAVIASFPLIREKIQGEKKDETLKNVSVDMSGFTEGTVDRITVKKGDEEKILSYSGTEWRIGEDQADPDKIKKLFAGFSNLQIKETASQSEENHAKFEVTREKGLELILSQKGQIQTFFIGKIGPAAGEFYIRKEGIKNVYLVKGTLRDDLSQAADEWKKKEEAAEPEGDLEGATAGE